MRAPRGGFDVATVRAAQRGEQDALRDLLTEALPLVYNIVGFALQAHADVDDAVQETMMRAVRGLGELRDPGAFRSWLVAVALRQIHDHQRAHRAVLDRTMPLDEAFAVADPSAEFADLTALKLELTGQRQEVAEAAGWLDDGNRELLGLWWLSEHGRLDRAELAAALGVPQNQAAVRIQRLKEQLSATRVMVRALRAPERCRGLLDLTRRWDGHRNSLWRKRFVGHTRDCEVCDARSRDLVPVEKLLAGLPLAVVPTALAAAVFRAAMAAGAGSAGATGSAALGHGSSPAALGHGSTSSTALGHGSSAVGHGSGKALWFLPAKAPAVFAAVVTAGAVGVAATAVWAGSSTSGAVPLPPIATTSSPSPSVVVPPSRPASPTPTPKPSTSSTAPKPPATTPTTHPAVTGPKKGVAAWSAPGFDAALTSSQASWYYDWSPSRMDHLGTAGPQFVPMIWGAKNADATTLATARTQGSTLLAFNEPDMGSQSNMTVEQALDLWPKLQATGLRLGSPAVAANAATPGSWLDRFMTGAKARGYRIDFITVHWYGSNFSPAPAVDELQSYLKAIHDRYHLPIWLTEYALISFSGGTQYPTPNQQATFVTSSAAMLDALPYVERYAWFGLAASGSETGTALFQGGHATPMGLAYEAS